MYAQWYNADSTITVAYDANGGSGDPADQTCESGSTLTMSTTQPTRTGYTFLGWNTVADGSGSAFAPGAYTACTAKTFYAQWAPSTSVVAYDASGGSGDPADQSCTSGNVTLSTTVPTRTGYTFLGWNTAADGTGTAFAGGSTVSCADLTLYAQWVPDTSVVAYNANGGSGDPADQSCTSASMVTLSSTVPTRAGYTFLGWNTAAGGTGTAYAGGSTVSCADLTLYAQLSLIHI